jgi:TRAP-type uncharacterized transport system substrate-binding protein
LLVICTVAASSAQAQGTRAQQRLAAQQQHALRNAHNELTLLVVTGHHRHSYIGMVADMAGMLGGNGNIRLVPIAGSGGPDNLKDLLYLRGADMAIVASNVLLSEEVGEALGNLRSRLAYVTPLYGEEVHVLAGRDVDSVEALNGRKVAVPIADGNTLFAATDVFQRLGIKVR